MNEYDLGSDGIDDCENLKIFSRGFPLLFVSDFLTPSNTIYFVYRQLFIP